jgi:RNA polymerase sigma-70 factor (ECF subfamily)
MTQEETIIASLFRKEFSKMVAVLSRSFGLQHIETAEDIVSDTFLTATQNWNEKGIPPNPEGWLYAVAKQKTLYHFRRHKILDEKILPQLKKDMESFVGMDEPDFSSTGIKESQLQMMFAICDPVIASEAQIALALRVLCGFSIEEIAEAFFTNNETINKRLLRAKEKLRTEKISLALPSANKIEDRLDNVLHILYLLFNEGYYSTTNNKNLRRELCFEALYLVSLLTEFDGTNQPKTFALAALMCFHASRFDARQNEQSEMILYNEQDESLWDRSLIEKGAHLLERAAAGAELSSYHLEAGIAFWHSQKEDTKEKWESILQHYELLLQINYSPSVALNRAYALYKAGGREQAILEAEQLNLASNHFYHALLAEFYTGIDKEKALQHLNTAMQLAKTDTEKRVIHKKIKQLQEFPFRPG